MSSQLTPSLSLTMAMIIVGSSVVAGKLMVAELPVFLASMLRFLIALAILIPIITVSEGGLPVLSRRSWIRLGLQSLCGSFLFTISLLFGLQQTSSANAGIITACTPACMGLIAWLVLRERPTLRNAAGITASVLGLVIINGMHSESGFAGENPLLGNSLVLTAVIFESLFLLIRKSIREPISPLAVSTIVSMFGLLWFLPMGLYETFTTDILSISLTGWLTVFYYGAIVTVLAYLFWFAGITKVTAAKAGVFTAIMPVTALVLSAIVLDDHIGWGHIMGCGCVLTGIILIATRSA